MHPSKPPAAIWRHTLGDLLRRTAARYPDKVGDRLRRGALDLRRVRRGVQPACRAAWRGIGVGAGDRVAVLSRNSHAFAALRFALARIGAVLVPINFMLNADEVAYILRARRRHGCCAQADSWPGALARAAAAQDTAGRGILWLPGEEPAEPAPGMTAFDALLAATASPPRSSRSTRGALAQIVYTSGTESLPKGAMLTHDAVIGQYVSCIVDGEIAETDRLLHALPLYHCAQLDVFLGPAIYVGATNVITGKPTPDNLLPLLEQHRITSFFAPPTVWIALLRSPLFDTTDLSALRKGYYGASIMPVEVLQEMQRRLPQLRLWNFYGQTEIAPLATVLKPEDQLRKAGSAGARCSTSRRAWSTTRCTTWRRARSARSCTARRSCCRATSTTTSAPRRPSRAAGSTAAIWRRSTTRATSRSSTARRT